MEDRPWLREGAGAGYAASRTGYSEDPQTVDGAVYDPGPVSVSEGPSGPGGTDSGIFGTMPSRMGWTFEDDE